MICHGSRTAVVCACAILFVLQAAAGQEGQEGQETKEPQETAEPEATQEPQEPSQKEGPSAQEPEFTKASSRTSFEKGKALFAEGKYKDADALFKKVKSDAKNKTDKEIVEKWLLGAAGGLILEKLKPQVSRGPLAAHDQTEAIGLKYRGTPAEALFRRFLDDLEAQLYVPVEYFDVVSPRFSAKYGKKFLSDPRIVFQGAQCLQWTNTKDRRAAALQLDNVPRNWNEYSSLELWANVTIPPVGAQLVVFSGDPPSKTKARTVKKKTKSTSQVFFYGKLKFSGSPGTWQRVRVPIGELQGQGGPSLDRITSCQIQVPGGTQFNFLIDKVSLIKKDEASGAKGKKTP